MPVIDASVYVAIVNVDDIHHRESRQWIEITLKAGETIQAPVIILGEVGAAISRGAKNPQLALKAVERLERSGIIQLIPISLSLAKSAGRIAIEQRIRGCDALYVALAANTGEPLVTWDRQQKERGAELAITLTPRSHS